MTSSYNPKIITDNLTCYLDAYNPKSNPGSGTTWFDLTKNGYNSTLTASAAFSNDVVTFDGIGERDGSPTGSYISLNTTATTTDPTVKTAGVTYEAWLRCTAEQPFGHCLFFGSGTINHLELKGSLSSAYYRTEAVTENGYSFSGTAGSAGSDGGHSVNEWWHLCLVFANGETNRPVRWYRDGEQFGLSNMTGGVNPTTEYFRPSAFGRSTGNTDFLYANSFKGELAALRFYDATLTDGQIVQNFNAQRARYGL